MDEFLASTARPTDSGRLVQALKGSRKTKNRGHTDVETYSAGGACLAATTQFGMARIAQTEAWVAVIAGRPRFVGQPESEESVPRNAAALLIDLFGVHGIKTPQYVHGTFAFVVIHRQSGDAFAAIDRLGVGTLSFSSESGQFLAGTSTDTLAEILHAPPTIDPQAIFNYFYCHMVPAPGTIYRGIQKLLPAQWVEFKQGKMQRGFYWEMPYRDDNREPLDALTQQFKSILGDAVSRSAASDNVGAFLSGGTDSSTIAGMLTQTQGHPAETYSIGFNAEGYDEIGYARIASNHFGTRPHEYYVTPADVVAAVPSIAAAYDEPFGNASAVPTYCCAKFAHADGIKVLLAGDGGDEIFGGNARYAKQKVFDIYSSVPLAVRRALVEPVAFRFPVLNATPLFKKAQSYIQQANIPLPDRLESYNFLAREPLTQIFPAEFLNSIDANQPTELMREVYDRTRSSVPANRMMHLDLKQTLADNDLRKVGRMCGLAGVEVRYPLLDEQLVEFSAKLAPDLKVRGQQLRYFFKDALKDFLPPEILTKSKHGFGLPFGLWMQTDPALRDLAYDSLAKFRGRGFIRPDYIDHLLAQHKGPHAAYYGVMIWVIMMLEQWMSARR